MKRNFADEGALAGQAYNKQFTPGANDRQDLLEFRIEIPHELQQHIPVIIGPSGKTIKWICKEAGVKLIQISKDDPSMPGLARNALIKGPTVESLQAAATLVNNILHNDSAREHTRTVQMEEIRGGSANPTTMPRSAMPAQHQSMSPMSMTPQTQMGMPQNAYGADTQNVYGVEAQNAAAAAAMGAAAQSQVDMSTVLQLMHQNFEAVFAKVAVLDTSLEGIRTRLSLMEGRVAQLEAPVGR